MGWFDRIRNVLRRTRSDKASVAPRGDQRSPSSQLPAPSLRLPVETPAPVIREAAGPPVPSSERAERPKPIARHRLRKVTPHPWSTQFVEPPHRKNAYLVIGLDFGTSCSKVVIRSPFMFEARALAVPFGPLGHASSQYLLPTRLCHDLRNDRLSLSGNDESECLIEMKMRMMKHPENVQLVAFGAAYLAHVIRLSREWFLKTQRDGYGRFGLRWALNVGVPSAGYDDEVIRQAFTLAASAAWVLSIEEGDICFGRAAAVTEAVKAGDLEPDIAIDVIPEVAAEVVGYARSPLRTPGLHVMVDVGASTLDICSFILHDREGMDQYALPTALVEHLGVINLHRRRLAAINGHPLSSTVQSIDSADPLAMIPETAAEYVDPASNIGKHLAAVDQEHSNECRYALMRTIVDLKTCREPRSPRWSDGLPVFLCGGGSLMSCFRRVIKDANFGMVKLNIGAGIRCQALPRPEALKNKDLKEEIFGRLAVAYGLSFDSLDIGTIVSPSDIEDASRRSSTDWRDGFISKDQV